MNPQWWNQYAMIPQFFVPQFYHPFSVPPPPLTVPPIVNPTANAIVTNPASMVSNHTVGEKKADESKTSTEILPLNRRRTKDQPRWSDRRRCTKPSVGVNIGRMPNKSSNVDENKAMNSRKSSQDDRNKSMLAQKSSKDDRIRSTQFCQTKRNPAFKSDESVRDQQRKKRVRRKSKVTWDRTVGNSLLPTNFGSMNSNSKKVEPNRMNKGYSPDQQIENDNLAVAVLAIAMAFSSSPHSAEPELD